MQTEFPTQPSYRTQRDQFLAVATAAGATLTEYPHPLKGPFGEPLSTDVAVLGDPGAKRLLIALSGTHGVEGFYGSGCQIKWLQELGKRSLPADVAVVMIHLINPWGTAWLRRVNEDNIDLNRNHLNFDHALPDNQAYAALHEIYACTELQGPERDRADALLDEQIAEHGWPAVMSIVEGGQHRHPDGLFYGGLAPSWSNRTLHQIIQKHVSHAEVAMCFDLHTGAGEYGHPMLLTITEAAYPALADAQAIYGPWLYTLAHRRRHAERNRRCGHRHRLHLAGVDQCVAARAVDAVCDRVRDVSRAPEVHRHLRDDHWLHLHGNPSDAVGRGIKLNLLEQFYPADSDWQAMVWLRTWQIWERALSALPAIRS